MLDIEIESRLNTVLTVLEQKLAAHSDQLDAFYYQLYKSETSVEKMWRLEILYQRVDFTKYAGLPLAEWQKHFEDYKNFSELEIYASIVRSLRHYKNKPKLLLKFNPVSPSIYGIRDPSPVAALEKYMVQDGYQRVII